MMILGFALVTAAVLALATVGFSLQFGITNFINVAYGDLMTLSAFFWYTGANDFHWNLWVSGAIALIATGLIAVGINRGIFQPILRRGARPFTLMIVTLGIGLLIENIALIIWGPNYLSIHVSGNRPILHWAGMIFSVNQVIIILIALAVMATLHLILTRTFIGKAMRAMSDDILLTRVCGIRSARVQDITWFISGALAALAGMVLALNTATFETTTGNGYLWLLIPAAFLGGIGSPYGAMAGAAIMGVVIEVSGSFFGPQFNVAAAMVVLFAVLLVRPQGIVAVVRKSWGE